MSLFSRGCPSAIQGILHTFLNLRKLAGREIGKKPPVSRLVQIRMPPPHVKTYNGQIYTRVISRPPRRIFLCRNKHCSAAVSHRCLRIIGRVVLFRMVVSVHLILPSVHCTGSGLQPPTVVCIVVLTLPSTLHHPPSPKTTNMSGTRQSAHISCCRRDRVFTYINCCVRQAHLRFLLIHLQRNNILSFSNNLHLDSLQLTDILICITQHDMIKIIYRKIIDSKQWESLGGQSCVYSTLSFTLTSVVKTAQQPARVTHNYLILCL